MIDHQVVAGPADRGPRAAREDAALRRLLSGTVFDPRAVRSAQEPQDPAGEQDSRPAAHCRYAMYYAD
ncbi:hypothetical protein GCM10010441_44040 [Kitasatospora paracochleata]|uniref:Uncharacterized protein n=1 Tax=Kitasatospora paracochleata TaxID=58354 RepID=A0ABT1IVN3_9ACTN|nr:hypothetical protein [Kitasatospora paracochleata]MCP2309205.1 hypothetical protein [Kitasatospora paracochleata]